MTFLLALLPVIAVVALGFLLASHDFPPAEGWRAIERLSTATYDLPQHLTEVLDDLRRGRLTLRTETADQGHIVDRLGRRIFAGLVTCAFIFSGAWLIARPAGAAQYVGIAMLVFGVIWMGGHMLLDLRR